MKEIKGTAESVVLFKEKAFKDNDSYNVRLQGDPNQYSYLCQGVPKIKTGVEQVFLVEEKEANGRSWFSIKLKPEPKPFGAAGGFKSRPNYSFALEFARKMYNSSQQTNDQWDIDRMLEVASYLLKRLNDGVDRDAVDSSVTISCASAMAGISIDSKVLAGNIKIFQDWVNKSK